MKKIIILFLFFSCGLSSFAQGIKDNKEDKKEQTFDKKDLDNIATNIDGITEMKDLESILKICKDSLSKIEKVQKDKVRLQKLLEAKTAYDNDKEKRDVNIQKGKNLDNDSIAILNANEMHKNQTLVADSLCAVACYQLLKIKPDKYFYSDKILPAYELFKQIKLNENVMKSYQGLNDLLPHYLDYYNEVRKLLVELCTKKTLTANDVKTYKNRLYALPYYTKYYGEKISIYYLDDQIDRVEKGIDARDTKSLNNTLTNWFPMLSSRSSGSKEDISTDTTEKERKDSTAETEKDKKETTKDETPKITKEQVNNEAKDILKDAEEKSDAKTEEKGMTIKEVAKESGELLNKVNGGNSKEQTKNENSKTKTKSSTKPKTKVTDNSELDKLNENEVQVEFGSK